MTTWSILLEAPLFSDEEPGEAEMLVLDALEMLGAEAPVTGGGHGDTLAARFCIGAPNLWAAAEEARSIFWEAVSKAGVKVNDALSLEVMPADAVAAAYGVADALS